jgi:uncharacterized Rmd1/YagE family protein
MTEQSDIISLFCCGDSGDLLNLVTEAVISPILWQYTENPEFPLLETVSYDKLQPLKFEPCETYYVISEIIRFGCENQILNDNDTEDCIGINVEVGDLLCEIVKETFQRTCYTSIEKSTWKNPDFVPVNIYKIKKGGIELTVVLYEYSTTATFHIDSDKEQLYNGSFDDVSWIKEIDTILSKIPKPNPKLSFTDAVYITTTIGSGKLEIDGVFTDYKRAVKSLVTQHHKYSFIHKVKAWDCVFQVKSAQSLVRDDNVVLLHEAATPDCFRTIEILPDGRVVLWDRTTSQMKKYLKQLN